MFNSSQKNKYAKISNRGFTLIESLVAISILSLSIAAAFTAVQGGLQSSSYAKDQITAFYLAQEGMEFVRNKLDENALYTVDGDPRNQLYGIADGATAPCYFGHVCMIDAKLEQIFYCGTTLGSCPDVQQDTPANNPFSATYFYGNTPGWTDTGFKREIQIQDVVHDQEIAVIINISWTSRGTAKSFQVRQSFFNHQ